MTNRIMELAEDVVRAYSGLTVVDLQKARDALQEEVTRMEAELDTLHETRMHVKHLQMMLDEKTLLAAGYKAKLAALEGMTAAPEGYKLVPIEPTPAMINAAHLCNPPESKKWHRMLREKYKAMLAAAQEPTK